MDYGLAEKADKVAVVPVDMAWSDLGSWDSIYQRHEKDKQNNVIHGEVLTQDTTNSLLWSQSSLLATAGLDNIVVIQTADATLICDRSRTEEIKTLVARVKEHKPELTEIHQTVYRPWGSYTVLEENTNFKIKRIVVNPGAKLSMQMHKHRSEHWVVVSGEATITNGDMEFTLQANQSTYIPKTHRHRLANNGALPLSIIEVQCGEYVGEDDIVRFDDTYGRLTTKMTKVALITGVTGQDGAYLAEFLLNKGYTVHGVKRRSSLFNTDRIDHLYQDPHVDHQNFILHYGDLTDSTNLIRIIQQTQPDEIYNLAAMSHVAVSFETPEYTANADGIGTLRILEAIRILGLEKKTKFYQASTSELYGLVQETPQKETTPFYPRSPYAVAKLYAYWITVNYREAYGIYACNGILFNHESPVRGETFVTRKITSALARIKLRFARLFVLGQSGCVA